MFTVSHDGTIDTVVMWDILTVVISSKQDITGERELPGGHYSIHEDDNGTQEKTIHEYDGNEDGSPQIVTGILEADKEYWLVEDLSPTGYAYSEAVKFTVDRDGNTTYVVMQDKETHIDFRKENTSGELLGRAVLQVIDYNGVVIEEFETLENEIYTMKGKLIADATYTLREKTAPFGYSKAADIIFTVSLTIGGNGCISFGGLSNTGDKRTITYVVIGLASLSFFGFVALVKKWRKEKDEPDET